MEGIKGKEQGVQFGSTTVRAVVTVNGEKLGLVGQCALVINIGGFSAVHMVLLAPSLPSWG